MLKRCSIGSAWGERWMQPARRLDVDMTDETLGAA